MIRIEPEFRRKPGFKMIGVERYTDDQSNIMKAWDGLSARIGDVPNRGSASHMVGFEDYSRDFQLIPGVFPKFYYIAAVTVESLDEIPEGMVGKEVPEADYAVFVYRGSLMQLGLVFRFIYDEWLPGGEYDIDPAVMADFEWYPETVSDPGNAVVEIHVPIVPRRRESDG